MHNAAVDTMGLGGKGVAAPAASNNMDLLDLLGGTLEGFRSFHLQFNPSNLFL